MELDQKDDAQDVTPKSSINRKNLKRTRGNIETSTDDIYELIVNMSTKLSNEIKRVCSTMKNELMERLDEKFNMLNSIIEEINIKVGKLEESVERHDKKLDQQGKIVNRLLQERLKNNMEISGVNLPAVKDKSKTKEEAIKIIENFGINVKSSDVKSVYIKSITTKESQKNQIMTVEFKEFETKLRILKEKRKSGIKNGIYFDDSLTPTNRFLIGKAKRIAKEKNFMLFMSNNRINVKKADKMIKWIEDESDLLEIEKWLPNEKKQRDEKNSKQAVIH